MCGASYCPATAYTAVHGYAPSCTWRVIAGTSHPEHEHVIFVYLEIWHPRSHPTSRFWTSRILDLWISDSGSLDLEIWRVGSGSGGPDPSGPSGYPETPPFGGQFYSTLAPCPGPKPLCTTPNGGQVGCLLDPGSLAPRVLSPSSWVSYIYLRARA